MEQRIHDTIAHDAWCVRCMQQTYRGRHTTLPPMPLPFATKLSLNPTPSNLAQLAYNLYMGQNYYWGYRIAQFVHPDCNGLASFVLGKTSAKGLGGVTRNLLSAQLIFRFMLKRWNNRENSLCGYGGDTTIQAELLSIENTAACIIQQCRCKQLRRRDVSRFVLFLCDQKLGGKKMLPQGHRLNNSLLHLILLFCVGGRQGTRNKA